MCGILHVYITRNYSFFRLVKLNISLFIEHLLEIEYTLISEQPGEIKRAEAPLLSYLKDVSQICNLSALKRILELTSNRPGADLT